MTCKDCIHFDRCEIADNACFVNEEFKKADCPDFKNKANFVEVVRCKDCKHKQELDKYEKRAYVEGCVACTQISPYSDRLVMLPNDFCSYGERKSL